MNPRNRRGISLAEMVLSMAVLATILGLTVPIVSRMFLGYQMLKQEVVWQQSLRQLGEQWRNDIAECTSVRDEDGQISVIVGDQPIVYQWHGSELVRTIDGDVAKYEGYAFPSDTTSTLTINQENQMVILALAIEPKGRDRLDVELLTYAAAIRPPKEPT